MLTTIQLSGFNWLQTAAAATATATATATGTTITIVASGTKTESVHTSGSSIVYTVPAGGIPAGSTIILCAANTDSRSITGASDTKGNTYLLGAISTLTMRSLFAQNITALVAGNLITVTFSGNCSDRYIIVAYATGLTISTLQDKSAGTAGASSTPSSGATAVTSQASELAIGTVLFFENATVTDPAGYTQVAGVSQASEAELHMAYKILSSTGAQTYAPTLDSSHSWGCAVETLRT